MDAREVGELNTLAVWESRLAGQIANVDLLGELAISEEDCSELGAHFYDRVRRWGPDEATDLLQRKYPHAIAVYLVAEGIYGYQGGDYWGKVSRVTGVTSPGHQRRWGQGFEQFLRQHHLPTFEEMVQTEGALRYVGRILAHGGIPNYCLPDFFSKLLQPAVARPRLSGMNAAELIGIWRGQSAAVYFTDKPVLRFLTQGGQVAEDFLDRCLEMARTYLERGTASSPDDLGLPSRVVNAYRSWVTREVVPVGAPWATGQARLRRPEVRLDPWGEGLVLDLPPQELLGYESATDIVWEVVAGEDTLSLQMTPIRRRERTEIRGKRVHLDRPSQVYEVALQLDGEPVRVWRFQGPTPGLPLLAFDPGRGALLQWRDWLPARPLWLLAPETYRLSTSGGGRLVEILPRMPGGWSGYQLQHWDLTGATAVVLTPPPPATTPLHLRVHSDESSGRPCLVGGNLVPFAPMQGQDPLYAGDWPAARVPLSPGRPAEEQLHRWRISVYTVGEATVGSVTRSLGDQPTLLVAGDSYVDVLLERLLPTDWPRFGTFGVRLRGPLGRDADLGFRAIPLIEVSGYDRLHLPSPEGILETIDLTISTRRGIDVQPIEGERGCHIESKQERPGNRTDYQVTVEPDSTVARLSLLDIGFGASVPLEVPVPRLRWGLIEGRGGLAAIEWSGRSLRCPAETVLKADPPLLMVGVSAPVRDRIPRPLLCLLDAYGSEQQRAEPGGIQSDARTWRFDLATFRDTVRASRSPALRLSLLLLVVLNHGTDCD